jgi:hypothetical protein
MATKGMRRSQSAPSAPGAKGTNSTRTLPPGPAPRGLDPRRDWLLGFAMLVWARSVVGPDVALLRVAVFAAEGVQRSQVLTGEARARVLGEALGAVWAVAQVALEQG